MNTNQDLIDLLDREFRRIESSTSKPFPPTVQVMADRLKLDKTFLSKLRSGERVLTKKKARHIAEQLRSGKPKEIAQLEKELLAADQAASRFLLEIKDWFDERAKPGNLMVVEFREPPVVRPEGGREWATKIVGEAVAGGLDYAMINPFCIESAAQHLPKAMQHFVNTLDEHLIETRKAILGYALDHLFAQNPKVTAQELKKVAERLKLYRLAADGVSPCPGLGYRLFYTERQEPARQMPISAEPTGGKLWEWISSKDQDHMVLKEYGEDLQRMMLKTTTIRFFPIVEFWREKNSLPQTKSDIVDFANQLETNEEYATRHGVSLATNPQLWSIIGNDDAVVSKYLEKKGKLL